MLQRHGILKCAGCAGDDSRVTEFMRLWRAEGAGVGFVAFTALCLWLLARRRSHWQALRHPISMDNPRWNLPGHQ